MNTKNVATLTGLAVGDALGMPFETMGFYSEALTSWDGEFQDSLSEVTGHLKAGQWTDDTQMARALADSLILSQTYSPAEAAKQYLAWFQSSDVRGIGSTTERALQQLQSGIPWILSGVEGAEGNGTAMRAAPIGVVFRNNIQAVAELARVDAAITHRSVEASEGSVAVATAVAHLLNGVAKADLCTEVLKSLKESQVKRSIEDVQSVLNITSQKIAYQEALEALVTMGTNAHVVKTVPAAFFAFLCTSSFREAVYLAVTAGGDTDTTAAVTGALAGSCYGYDALGDYAKGVEDSQDLHDLEEQLFEMAKAFPSFG